MGSSRRAERDPELDRYLDRVEELDSKRYGCKGARNDDAKNKPKYNPQDLERAQKLLSGEYPTFDERPTTFSSRNASEMAYRSAYNYEKSFSPKRNSHTTRSPIRPVKHPDSWTHDDCLDLAVSRFDSRDSARQYMVSEEDYLLLAKLKQGLAISPPQTTEEVREYPSRGKPRAYRPHNRYKEDVDNNNNNDHDDDSETPPPLPVRREAKNEKFIATPTKNASIKPPRPQVLTNSRSERIIDDCSKWDVGTRERSHPRPESSVFQTSSLKPNKTSFLESSQKTKATTSTAPKTDIEQKVTNNVHKPRTYLDSLQDNKLTVTTPHKFQPSTPSPTKPARPSRPFVASALKTESSKSTPQMKALAIPPRRKQIPAMSTDDKSDLELSSLRASLRSPEKRMSTADAPGTRNAFDVKLEVPKTRKKTENDKIPGFLGKEALKPLPAASERKESVPEVMGRREMLVKAPPKPERKISVPEAIGKKGNLSKAPPKPVMKASLPEAVSKLSTLAKAPPKPTRKISMPEALKKLELIKAKKLKEEAELLSDSDEKGHRSLTDDKKVWPRDARDGREKAPVFSKKPLNREVSKTAPELGQRANVPIAIPFMVQGDSATIAKLLSPASVSESNLSELNGSNDNKLVHPTKGRARGPKRKPPKLV
ncbi:LAME_0F19702g1_1 [Lachancea meyersii CBS 8951]|uniref:LAME_0F19702g1_1 n=1 Tax=Lachancea meyersii CBS 8951 TaxID=1266667 RepID=A0A1G4K1L1_9SACH|nr:LAME_0F19702g1_1 [Lachancea meyersii CBS 8951]